MADLRLDRADTPLTTKAVVPGGEDNPFSLENPGILELAPPEPHNIEDTGVTLGLLADIALRYLYYAGSGTGLSIADQLRLPWAQVVERVIDHLAAEKLTDLRGGKGFGRASVDFVLTDKGREYAKDALGRSTYVGPAPIPLEQYNALITRQSHETPVLGREELEAGLAHLVIQPGLVDKIGPAVNSGRSLLLYGPPGNGKTALAEAISATLGGEVFVPHALEVDHHIIQVFDPLTHLPLSLERKDGRRTSVSMDKRWYLCRRPSVVVGGELTLETLDLIYSERSRYYEAPFQVKANGGMLLIDDFGRQRVAPTDLLNRWIVPLEKRADYLTLHTGKKFELPFELLLVFSTNLDPRDLVDEAFLRRIKYKLEVQSPDEKQYREIFRRACESSDVPYVDQAITYLLDHFYKPRKITPRACHPRDLVQLIRDTARYRQVPPALSKELLEQACQVFLTTL